MPSPTDRTQPIPALVVATWYPGVDDPGRGRFVADQVEALAATGRVRPLVASFDVAYVHSTAGADRAGTVVAHLRAGLRSGRGVVSPGGSYAPRGLGTARLPTAEPYGRASLPAGEEAEQRRVALELLVDRLETGSTTGVVHAHTAYPDGYAGLAAARRLGWPLVITEHSSFVARQLRNPEQRRRYLEAAEGAARFIAVGEILAGELREAIPEIAEKLVVVPNVVAIDAFEAAGFEEREPAELLFVGNRKERKGMVVLLRAFADVLEERPDATLRLIGKSTTYEEEERWKRIAEDYGVAHAVRFESPIDRPGIARALGRASVFVHPSPRETFGMVTLEALASGLPVVSTRSGGISGILEDERLGELVPPQDSRMLARAVLRVLDRRDRFDPGTLRRAVEPFAGPVVAERLIGLYEDAIGEAGPPGRPPVATASVPWSGSADEVGATILAIANDTDRAARFLSRMPADLLRRVTLVTDGVSTYEQLPAGIGRVVATRGHVEEELRRRGLYGPRGSLLDRIARVVRNPVRPLRRRLSRRSLAEERWQASVGGIRAALEVSSAVDAATSADFFCLDVVDYAVAAPLIAAGRGRAAPGGLLWLADQWAAAPGVGGASPAGADDAAAAVGSSSTAS